MDSSNASVFRALNISPLQFFKSRQALLHYVDQLPVNLQAKGYLAASVDSLLESDTMFTARIFTGQLYKWRQARIDQKDWPILQSLGYAASSFIIADPAAISSLPDRVIRRLAAIGHPFARAGWDSIELNENEVSATLRIDRGPLYRMDSLGLHGPLKISRRFLQRHLGLTSGGIYDQEILDQIDDRLAELPYLEQSQPWQLAMHSSGYAVELFLQPKQSNKVDALIGLLPSNQQNGGRLLLTVDAELLLQNALAAGETIHLNWEQIQPRSPRLMMSYVQPYVWGSRVGAEAGFHLYKKDSSFLNISGRIGAHYRLSSNESLGILLQLQRTNLLNVDTTAVLVSKRLPADIDLSLASLAVEYQLQTTDNRFTPRRGWNISMNASAGRKTIRRNNAITSLKDPSVNFAGLYDSLRLNSYQLRLRWTNEYFIPSGKRAVIRTALQMGGLLTQDYFRNEMFQVGGFRTLRGFDEESIFANLFIVPTLEYRYLTGANSYFFAFTDGGYTRTRNQSTVASHTYVGAGAGMALQSRQGILNISYAVGKRNDIPFSFRQSKIHIGFTSFF